MGVDSCSESGRGVDPCSGSGVEACCSRSLVRVDFRANLDLRIAHLRLRSLRLALVLWRIRAVNEKTDGKGSLWPLRFTCFPKQKTKNN